MPTISSNQIVHHVTVFLKNPENHLQSGEGVFGNMVGISQSGEDFLKKPQQYIAVKTRLPNGLISTNLEPENATVAVVRSKTQCDLEVQNSRVIYHFFENIISVDVMKRMEHIRASHSVSQTRVNSEIALVSDRRTYLMNRMLIPRGSMVNAMTSASDPLDFKEKPTSSQLNELNKIKIRSMSMPATFHESDLICQPATKEVPIELPDLLEEHTMNVTSYLRNRMSSGVMDFAKNHGCEFFCGGNEASMLNYYKKRGFDQCSEISSNTSTKNYIFSSKMDGVSILVMSGMGSSTRIAHQMLQLHYSGVDVDRMVTMIGSIKELKQKMLDELQQELTKPISVDEKVLFIGVRRKIMEHIAEIEFNSEISGDETYKKLVSEGKIIQHTVANFTFDSTIVEKEGKKVLFSALRMPNGDLAYDACKAFLAGGYSHIILCGAGGRICGDAKVGDYVALSSSEHNGQTVSLEKIDNIKRIVPEGLDFLKQDITTNTTVNSPLVETKNWLDKNRKSEIGTVDVETAHIFRAINEAERDILVIPGMFVSDVLGSHPLDEKINADAAYSRVGAFVDATLKDLWKRF